MEFKIDCLKSLLLVFIFFMLELYGSPIFININESVNYLLTLNFVFIISRNFYFVVKDYYRRSRFVNYFVDWGVFMYWGIYDYLGKIGLYRGDFLVSGLGFF